MTDHSAATLVWQTDPPSKEIIALVREHIADSLTDLDEPQELLFHHIPLDRIQGFNGPAVILTGNEQFNGFNASYHPDGYTGMAFKLDDFPDIEEAMEAAVERMKAKKDDDNSGKA